jgi:predicted transcriptional regulator
MQEDLLALSRRRTIYEYVLKFPGTYIREMERALSLSLGDLQYHIHKLEQGGIISSHEEGKRKRYFVNHVVKYQDRDIISILRLKTPRRIVLFLLSSPNSTFKEILSEFPFTKGALSFHLKKLSKAGILQKSKREKENIYSIMDENRIGEILITYRSSILDNTLDSVIDVFTKIG